MALAQSGSLHHKAGDTFRIDPRWCRPGPEQGWDSREVVVNVVDTDYYVTTPTPGFHKSCQDGSYPSEVPIIRMFGTTACGRSACIHVHGVIPYFYIDISTIPDFNIAHCDAFCSALQNILGPGGNNKFLSVTLVERAPLLGFHTEQRPFLKIECSLPALVGQARRRIEKEGVAFPALWTGRRTFQSYEANILFELRYLIDSGVNGCDWVRLPASSYWHRGAAMAGSGIIGSAGGATAASSGARSMAVDGSSSQSPFPRVSNCTYEVDVFAADLVRAADADPVIGTTIAPFRILSFDIECCADGGRFPDAERDSVIQIGCVVAEQGAIDAAGDGAAVARVVFTLGTCAHIVGADVLSFDSEADLLLAFRQFVVATDCDFVTGYNIQNFDWPYICGRADALKGGDPRLNQFMKLSRISQYRCELRKNTFQSKAHGKRDFFDLNLPGRVTVDVLVSVQREHKLRSYTLNAVSATFLGDQKEDVHHSIIATLQGGDAETRCRLARYCLKDALLPVRLLVRLRVVVNLVEMARVAGVPVQMLMNRGEQIKVFACILRRTGARNLLFPTYDSSGPSDTVGYEGAAVLDPVKGLHDEPVATLDFASLYPSIMMAHNLCYSTLVRSRADAERRGLVEGRDFFVTAQGACFVTATVSKGLLPDILRELLAARKAARRAMADAEAAGNSTLASILNGRQLALKITANSVYGFTGATVGKLPCLEISSAVTGVGRDMIHRVKARVEEVYCKANGYEFDAHVIYGDTDSVMVKFGHPHERLAEVLKLGVEAAAEVSKLFIDPIKLEFEKVYSPYLLMSRKRYAGLLWTKPDAYDKLDMKGIESVRRDNCPLVKNVTNTVLAKLLIDRSVPAAVDYAKGVISDLLMNRLDISHLVISKSYSKKEGEYGAKQAHVELVKRMAKRDPATAPAVGDRVPYVFVKGGAKALNSDKSEDPIYVLEHNIPIDTQHYLEHQLAKPLLRIFDGVIPDPNTLLKGEHTRQRLIATPDKALGGIMKFARVTQQCLSCRKAMDGEDVRVSRAVCAACLSSGREQPAFLDEVAKRNQLEYLQSALWSQCQRCQQSCVQNVLCRSRDCAVFYMRTKVQMDLATQQKVVDRFGSLDW